MIGSFKQFCFLKAFGGFNDRCPGYPWHHFTKWPRPSTSRCRRTPGIKCRH
ncbi:hypothetical protein HanRHA438_Chr14g0675311 [Helianthus annuus]|nr:hypothetical protein HanRHA438_Chr14g0675311 [Helianthus annuus]